MGRRSAAARRGPRVPRSVVGALAIAVFLGLIWFGYEVANGIPGVPYHNVTAQFADVAGLRTGNGVRVDSVRVGQVSAIGYRDHHATVTIQLPPGYKVYRDATAGIGARNALGVDFVELDPGHPSSGLLTSNVIPVQRTTGLVTYDRVIDIFRPPTAAALGQLLRTLGGGFGGHGADLQALLQHAPTDLADLSTISRALADPSTGLPQLLSSAELLASRFQGMYPQISSLIANLHATLAAVGTHGGTALSQTLSQAPATLAAARPALDALAAAAGTAAQAVGTLRPGLAALGQATPTLEQVLLQSLGPLHQLVPVATQAVPGVQALTTTARRAQPAAPLVRRAITSAAVPVAYLAPYAQEVSTWFTYARSATNQGDANGHWLRFIPVVGADSIAGVLPTVDPLTCRNPFPAPGQAATQHGNLALLGGCR